MKHHVNAIIYDDFWQVAKHEKLQEGDFEVESSMSFGSSHWCRSMPDYEHRPTDFNEHRSTSLPKNRLTTPAESVASCNAVRIMTHEEFAARHPHLTHFNIDRHCEPAIDRQRETINYRQPPAPINQRPPLTYRMQLPKIDVA